MADWTPADIPDLHGKRALVTGATDGLGLETARMLAAKGAQVVLTGRNPEKGARALERVRAAAPGADVAFEPAELGDLGQVRGLARRVAERPLDILVNNAGVMGLPERRLTADGFETNFGVNYLSHFVLTGELLAALRAAPAGRVVSLSSLAHRTGRIDFDDLQAERGYKAFKSYGESKLAMLLFARELQTRSDRHGWGLTSAAAHPGFAITNLMGADDFPAGVSQVANFFGRMASHDAAGGAGPQVLAATRPGLAPASYWGPNGLMETKGPPAPAKLSRGARDDAVAARLWEVSQALTGYPFGEGA